MPYSNRPTPEDLDRLMERLGPTIARRFRAQGISEAEAAKRVEEALVELAHRWNRVGDRERWLLKRLSEGAPRLPIPPEKEPDHE